MSSIISGSIFIRMMGDEEGVLPGTVIPVHEHNFDHTSIFFNGDWHVKMWNADKELKHDFKRAGPFHLLIGKDCRHEFTFLGGAERGKAWCVFSHRSPDGEVANEWTGWLDAYAIPTQGA
jgi:hypothetical protein